MSDLDEFEKFMHAHQDRVFTTAFRLLGNEADACDVVQETFIKAYKTRESLLNDPAAGGWLKIVVSRLALNHLKRYRSRWSFFSEIQGEEDEELPFAASEPAQQTAEFNAEELDGLLKTLPDKQRVPLVLFHLEGFSYEEIAIQLGVGVGKLKTDMHRGRLSLKEKLTRMNHQEPKLYEPRREF